MRAQSSRCSPDNYGLGQIYFFTGLRLHICTFILENNNFYCTLKIYHSPENRCMKMSQCGIALTLPGKYNPELRTIGQPMREVNDENYYACQVDDINPPCIRQGSF